ncbi:glycosyltransferase [Paenibacillus rigui]|uniref:Glycosyl transferase n=1 Tax=Paenibacillus rigui TaxID=554312 RepID=A0A229USI1_9BACL|nr:glycosyltransferase [Paenibacillus rigui]OXM86354.1 glycosyl transferase [Paenibacillus rigui]
MKTSIVILTYNKLEYTQQCIESIREYTEQGTYEIIVVDNNSTDDTPNWLRKQNDLHVIYNSENLGFPKGCNQGMEVSTGDQILLLNNDTVVTKNWLSNLVTCLYSEPTIGAVGSITNSCSYYQSIDTAYKNMSEMQAFAQQINNSNPSMWEERLKLVGFCMLFKRSAMDQIGLLDERFTPGNYEDDDYSLRLRRAGYKLMLCRDSFIHHYGSVSFGENSERFSAVLHENKKRFIEKWGFIPGESEIIKHELIQLIQEPQDSPVSILELGCGRGGTLLKLRNVFRNSILYGVEDQPVALIDVKSVATGCGTAADMNALLENQVFDYIILKELPATVEDAAVYLRRLLKYLKPQGHLLTSIYNLSHFSVIKDLCQNRFSGHRKNTFSFGEIERIFHEAGYTRTIMSATVLNESQEDKRYIEQLCKMNHHTEHRQQYVIYLFHVKAGQEASIKTDIISLLESINKEEDALPLVKLLHEYEYGYVIECVNSVSVNKVSLLNKIAVYSYYLEKYEYALHLLQHAYGMDRHNSDTLYNLASVCNQLGDKKLALELVTLIPKQDSPEVMQLKELITVQG